MVDHVQQTCNCAQWNCPICAGGLFICAVCGRAEGDLTSSCYGKRLDAMAEDLAFVVNRSAEECRDGLEKILKISELSTEGEES